MRVDFEHPESGSPLDATLLLETLKHGFGIVSGKCRPLPKQLASKSNLVSVLYVEPSGQVLRLPQAVVRFYHPEGFEITDQATFLHVLVLRQLLRGGDTNDRTRTARNPLFQMWSRPGVRPRVVRQGLRSSR